MSSQAGSCCVEGEVHSGTPVGREQRLYGFDCYVSDPPEGEQPKAVVVILSDVFGWKLHNARILADEYAKRGHFKVMIPDFFEGTETRIEYSYILPWRANIGNRKRFTDFDDRVYDCSRTRHWLRSQN
jgi:dienelactone hydrolase